ncbi:MULTISPECIES: zinc-dependent alcohol dehydrogenase family protein [Ralstonia]|jgi:alcohol dehydrogenase|uniref:zinc-dependent alcohol dehydrogenase family protein n=1 Tax=Ralstonia wenshanensis TaxID=2842456 RepID=UPI001E4DEE42|nr:zinc-dependent alcohol dehydrogenase family protein [Ralstonia wenshanensis]MCT7304809.1 zinc-dependent alcohol dehydrogenase family protein [Ralstonia wenshanensis]MDY7509922.1 zinc-dependent alcohol dehydrogenase family protein [Ralstonia wenshanensis]UGS89405.1 zinc-dependent alcohol dehydrogenase family protein [Ralstonia wenshanensis]
MKAIVYEAFGAVPKHMNVPDPTPASDGVVVQVMASGVCRSDWHGWMGHDTDIELPHVPGHELAGVVAAVGADVTRWKVGDRVTVPFVAGCGHCPECHAGHQQVCEQQFQPGFTHWGSFAEYVGIGYADLNLVRLPDDLDFTTAASLGCRFVTAFRAVVDQGKTSAGQWVAVHGCGGVGLSAIMIANAIGANVVAIDISDSALELARALGAVATVNASRESDVVEAVRGITQGGAHVSLDALGHPATCFNSISNLRRRGKHVQVGLMLGDHTTPAVPMSKVIAHELEILGSHGMQAHRYGPMLDMIRTGKLQPGRMVRREISLSASIEALTNMNRFEAAGVTVITDFSS